MLLFRIDRGVTWGNVVRVNAMVAVVLLGNLGVKWLEGGDLGEGLMLGGFVGGLAGLLVVYGVMA